MYGRKWAIIHKSIHQQLYECLIMSVFVVTSVPDNLITSTSLSPANPIGIVGSSVTLTCTATLSVDVSGAMIKFEHGSIATNTIAAVPGTTQTNAPTINTVTISSVGSSYTCKVTVTAPGVCGGGGSKPACPTKTSNTIPLTVQCEW